MNESRSGKLVHIRHRCSINSTVDGQQVSLHSAISLRMWLMMGTDRGSIVRVLWTGEIVAEREVDVFPEDAISSFVCGLDKGSTSSDKGAHAVPRRSAVTSLSLGWQQRIGFVSKRGASGIFAPARTKRACSGNGEITSKVEEALFFLTGAGASSIALHKCRPLAVVGLKSRHVEVFSIGNTAGQVLRRISFPEHDLPEVLIACSRREHPSSSTSDSRTRSASASSTSSSNSAGWAMEDNGASAVEWAPDGSGYFCAGYDDIGYIIWSSSGCRAVTVNVYTPSASGNGTNSPASASPVPSPPQTPNSRFGNISNDRIGLLGQPTNYKACFAWAASGYNLVTGSLVVDTVSSSSSNPLQDAFGGEDGQVEEEDDQLINLSRIQLVKSALGPGQLASGSTSMVLQGWNHLLCLHNEEWDLQTLSWSHVDLPPMFIKPNGPIRGVALSLNGNYVAVSCQLGFAVYSRASKRWRLFESVAEEASLNCNLLFWWGDEVLCAVVRNNERRTWELLCFHRDRLNLRDVLCRATLPAKPVAVDTWFAEGVAVLLLPDRLMLFCMELLNGPSARFHREDQDMYEDYLESGPDDYNSENLAQGSKQANKGGVFAIRRASSSSIFGSSAASEGNAAALLNPLDGVNLKLLETVELDLDVHDDSRSPVSLCVIPCGATRRAGTAFKFPKCTILSSDGILFEVDMDEGSLKKLADGIFQVFPQSWSKIDQADDIVLQRYLEQSVFNAEDREKNPGDAGSNAASSPPSSFTVPPKLPSMLLFSIWIMDERGMRLWLPALDMEGESLSTRCTDAYTNVIPLGVLESHGMIIGITQRARMITKFRSPCFEFSVRVTPTTHAILLWLVRADRSDLAQQVLVQASTHLPLFRETLDLFLFSAVEQDYKFRSQHAKVGTAGATPTCHDVPSPLLPRVVKLLRTGKVTAILDNRAYDSLVVTCARKMEASRWDLFFEYAANPEQLFNDAIYNGDLNTAAGSMLIADYFSPQHSGKRLASLAHSAAVKGDSKLLRQIEHFQSTKLM